MLVREEVVLNRVKKAVIKLLELQCLGACCCLCETDNVEDISLKADFNSTRDKILWIKRQLNVPTSSFKDVDVYCWLVVQATTDRSFYYCWERLV